MVTETTTKITVPVLPSGIRFWGTYYQNGSLRDFLVGNKTFRFDPVYGHRLNPGSAVLVQRQKHNRLETYFRVVDADGFVPNSLSSLPTLDRLSRARDTCDRTVFIFGGSTVAGNSGFGPETEIAAHLETILNSRQSAGLTYIVVNAGVPAYGSDNQLRYLLHEILGLKPDIVVFYDGWNDASYLNGLISKYGNGYIQGRTRRSYSILEYCDHALILPKMLKHVAFLGSLNILDCIHKYVSKRTYFWLRSLLMPLTAAPMFDKPYDSYSFHKKSVDIYAYNIFCANALCRAMGINFLHFLQPLLSVGVKPLSEHETQVLKGQDVQEIDLYKRFYSEFEAHDFSKYGNDSDLKSVSLRQIFSQDPREIYIDTGHINSLGNSIIASVIADTILAATH